MKYTGGAHQYRPAISYPPDFKTSSLPRTSTLGNKDYQSYASSITRSLSTNRSSIMHGWMMTSYLALAFWLLLSFPRVRSIRVLVKPPRQTFVKVFTVVWFQAQTLRSRAWLHGHHRVSPVRRLEIRVLHSVVPVHVA